MHTDGIISLFSDSAYTLGELTTNEQHHSISCISREVKVKGLKIIHRDTVFVFLITN